ncbi:type II secretion system secretin GspD [uncultured Pseudoteredinibacter sp.]|uniref:type II secretion system secretin GspD n=1 Tax=uncultured Pseudoteredinibacter sp. TaxID=1641701 RepID=UPI002624247F|nr:type II secretion system secretin GspD [uncultured Pseudoteredinibacter sp.]
MIKNGKISPRLPLSKTLGSIKNSALRVQAYLLIVIAASFAQAAKSEQFEFTMNDVEMREFITSVGKITGRTIIIDPRVKGRVNINSRKSLSADEVYEIFLSQLQAHGYMAVLQGENILKVVLAPQAKLEGGLVSIGEDTEASDAIITRVIHLDHVAAKSLLNTLRPLVDSRIGVINAYEPSNTLIITDRSANIKRLLKIAENVDQQGQQDLEAIPLKNSSAASMAQLLSALLKANGDEKNNKVAIAYDQNSNSVLLRGPSRERLRFRSILRELDKGNDQQQRHQVVYLQYANAIKLQKILQGIEQPKQGIAGKQQANTDKALNVEVDEDINALILTGTQQAVSDAKALISQLDIRRAQVLIEAIIVELSDSLAKELGVQWLVGKDGQIGGGLSSSVGSLNAAALAGALLTDNDNALNNALSSANGLNLAGGRLRSNGLSFAVLINALSENTDSNILSTPSLLVTDNEEASILVGQEVPFITGSTTGSNNSNPFQTIDRKEVGIKLEVKPQINEGNAIQLKIQQEVSSLTGLQASDLITNKRTLNTTVLAEDGETIVLGGLMDERVQLVNSKVPILGDIPLLGRVFRSDNSEKTKRNLMVFLRPTIIRDQQLLNAISQKKYRYIRAEQLLKQDTGVPLLDNDIIPVLPVFEE